MFNRFESLVSRFAGLRATVIGDVMLDRYVVGRVRRISPEAPVPVVEVEKSFERPGGAGNVAANLTRLGCSTSIIATVGSDADGDELRKNLESANILVDALVVGLAHQTTVKTRIVAQNQQVVRVDREALARPDSSLEQLILNRFADNGTVDVVLLSDYAKGVLTPTICREIIRACRDRGIPVIVDPKGQDYSRYSGASAITPNQAEAALAIGSRDDDPPPFTDLARFLLDDLGIDAAIVTRGEHGVTVLLPERSPTHLPATAVEVADVTGAGDTFVATYALALAAGATVLESAYVANVAAGVVVGRVGAVTITPDELLGALQARSAQKPRRLAG